MKNMKIKSKLMVSFSILIVLAVIVGILGIFGMYQINEADDAMYEGNYLPTVLAGNISQNVYEQRTHLRSMVIFDVTDDAKAYNDAKSSLEQSMSAMTSFLNEYNGTISNDIDRAAYNEFKSSYEQTWLPFVSDIQQLSAAGRSNEAKALLATVGPAAAQTLDQVSSRLQEINMSDGKASVDSNTALFTTMVIIQAAVIIATIAIAVFLIFYISGLISKPLIVLTAFMKRAGTVGDISLSQEDLNNIAAYAAVKDEVGQCIDSTGKFIEHLLDISDHLEMVANGDLTSDVNLLSQSDVMGVSLNKMVSNLNGMFTEINFSTAQVSTGAKQIADGAQSLAQGSTEQAAAVQELSSSISEIAEKTKENAGMANKTATLANSIMSNAEKGSRQMGEMMAAVKEINEASQSINKVIKVIDDIAFQTNILALNAAVEAARAGQHGKGFAVVAEEVRNLAAKSAEAAKDTGSLIANSMEKAELGARIADETAASLNDIVAGINESTRLVSDIARSSDEQSAGISQINTGIDQVAQVVQQNSATAEESAAASEEMNSQADMLESLISQFKVKNAGANNFQSSPSPSKSANKPIAIPEKSGMSMGLGKY